MLKQMDENRNDHYLKCQSRTMFFFLIFNPILSIYAYISETQTPWKQMIRRIINYFNTLPKMRTSLTYTKIKWFRALGWNITCWHSKMAAMACSWLEISCPRTKSFINFLILILDSFALSLLPVPVSPLPDEFLLGLWLAACLPEVIGPEIYNFFPELTGHLDGLKSFINKMQSVALNASRDTSKGSKSKLVSPVSLLNIFFQICLPL